MLFIVRLILAGASRASIIAKHGKKAYDAAKKLMKTKKIYLKTIFLRKKK